MNKELYDIESVDEFIKLAEQERAKSDLFGEPHEVAKYNLWTTLKRYVLDIKKDLEL